MIVDGRMDGGEFLQTSHASETLHGAFSSSEWQVRVLNPVIEPPTRLLLFQRAHFCERCFVRRKTVGDDLFRSAMALHQFPEEFQSCSFVSALRNNRFQHLAFVIDSTPKIMPLAIHLHEYFVYVPLPFGERAQLLDSLSSDL